MRDLTTTVSVKRIQLENLRDVLLERSEHADTWHTRVTAVAPNLAPEDFAEELAGFLYELAGDLDDWHRTLSGMLGEMQD